MMSMQSFPTGDLLSIWQLMLAGSYARQHFVCGRSAERCPLTVAFRQHVIGARSEQWWWVCKSICKSFTTSKYKRKMQRCRSKVAVLCPCLYGTCTFCSNAKKLRHRQCACAPGPNCILDWRTWQRRCFLCILYSTTCLELQTALIKLTNMLEFYRQKKTRWHTPCTLVG